MARTICYRPIELSQWLIWAGYIALLLVAPVIFGSNHALTILSQIGTFAIATMSYNMLLGQTGMLSFGHAAYIGLGGFVAIHTMNLVIAQRIFWIPTSLIPLVGGIGGAFFGVLFGYVTTKRSGTTFAMITLGIGELVNSSVLTFPEFFGGEAGITTNRTMGHKILGISFGPQIQVYYLIAIWLIVCSVAMYAFTRTPLGRIANAVRDNPERVEFIGYNTRIVRYLVVIIAGFFAGVSGGLGAINFEIVGSENVGALLSGLVLFFTFLGGAGSFIGPLLGAVAYAITYLLLSSVTSAYGLYLGLMFLLMVMYAPGGVASIIQMNLRVALLGGARSLVFPYLVLILGSAPLFFGVTTLIELIYAVQLNEGNGTALTVYGVDLDASSLPTWAGVLILTIVGALLFHVSVRWFRGKWGAVQTQIAARAAKVAA